MNIVAIIKQVPEIELVRVDPATGEVILPSGPGVVNPFDEYAIEEGLRIREKVGGKLIVMTVGGEKAQSTLRQALSVGADEAYLLTDPGFENSDPQAIAKIIAAAVTKLGDIKLVLAGKQAIDDDAAQVPAALAAALDWPQVLFVRKTVDISEGDAVFQRTTEEGYDTVAASLPAVVSVVKEINEPRLPSLRGKMAAKKASITAWTAVEMNLETCNFGGNSKTRRLGAAPPPAREKGEIISGDTPEEIANNLVKRLRDNQVI